MKNPEIGKCICLNVLFGQCMQIPLASLIKSVGFCFLCKPKFFPPPPIFFLHTADFI